MFFFKLPVRSSVSFGREHGHGVEGRIWRQSVGPPLESGVPSRSPGLQMTGGVAAWSASRPAPVTFGACALNFKDHSGQLVPQPEKLELFEPEEFWSLGLGSGGSGVSEHDDPRGERDDGRLRGPRGRRGPKRAPSLVTFSESVRFGLCNPVRLPRTREHSSPPGWRAGCSVSSVVHRRNLTIGGLGPAPWRRAS